MTTTTAAKTYRIRLTAQGITRDLAFASQAEGEYWARWWVDAGHTVEIL
jgi:hypothetical protein